MYFVHKKAFTFARKISIYFSLKTKIIFYLEIRLRNGYTGLSGHSIIFGFEIRTISKSYNYFNCKIQFKVFIFFCLNSRIVLDGIEDLEPKLKSWSINMLGLLIYNTCCLMPGFYYNTQNNDHI